MKALDATLTGGLTGTVYTVNFSGTNTACRLEEATGKSFGECMADLRGPRPSLRLIRELARAAIIEPKDLTLDEAGDFVDDVGGWAVILGTLNPESPQAELVKEFLRIAADAEASLTAATEAPVPDGPVTH